MPMTRGMKGAGLAGSTWAGCHDGRPSIDADAPAWPCTLLAALTLAASSSCLAEQIKLYSPEDEALYQQRFQALMLGGGATGEGLSIYDPMEAVPGAADAAPLPAASTATIPSGALEEARAYSAANNSSALMIWRSGKVELEAYFGDYDADTLIVSRSLAKPLTVNAVGRAIALGKIRSLDQPVADFIDEWRDTDKAGILVRHLLDMRSGLLPQAAAMEPESILNRAYLHPRHDDIIVNEYPLTHVPGTRYEYSNATSDLVAVLIERATGMRYAEFISEQVLKPIGAAGGEVWITRPGGLAHAGCCIELPAETWLRLGVLLIRDGVWNGVRLLPEGYVGEIRTPTPQNVHAGLGVYIGQPYVERRGAGNPERFPGGTLHSEPYLADDLYLFDGNSNQVCYIVPSADLVILRTGGPPPKEPGWDNAYLPNLVLRGLRSSDSRARGAGATRVAVSKP